MNKVVVSDTVELIKAMAQRMMDSAKEMESVANQMQSENDLTLAIEAANIVSNLVPKLRLDLLVGRPIRAMDKALRSELVAVSAKGH